jgi:UDP-glucose 4-epimerase
MNILVTGGAGYIGSHTCIELIQAGHQVIVIDNLHNSKREAIRRIEEITSQPVTFYKLDLLDRPGMERLFEDHTFDAVIHFAALKAVGESVKIPLQYFKNNITGTINLLELMGHHDVKKLVFSSSATVYGDPQSVPIQESAPRFAVNPYGRTKLLTEEMLFDLFIADSSWNAILLRYFNPIGAHPSGKIGEDPNGIPNNLVPYIAQVAVGKLPYLNVYGNDYPTFDGTCIRDYIHVVDLAIGHVKALEKLASNPGVVAYNLGTGSGSSVLEVLQAFERACGKSIPYQFAPRRPGDAVQCYADPSLAQKELNWKAVRTLDDMCVDVWRWQSNNPQGFAGYE